VSGLYRFKTRRTVLGFHEISYTARWYLLITPLSTFLR
jgi:hypothetical protein